MNQAIHSANVSGRILERLQSLVSTTRVYGDPIDRDGTTIIPAFTVITGGGGGSGTDPRSSGSGEGGGAGVVGRPAGAYVIRAGKVSWKPAFSLNQALLVIAGAVWLVSRRFNRPT